MIGSVILFWLGLRNEDVQIEQQHLIALGLGIGTLYGFLFRQINKYKNRKIKFMKALSDNLYFKNLDNNMGVFYRLIDSAEEEEVKEAVIAYYFLLTAKERLTKKELDRRIENWLTEKWNCRIDFEIGDAVNKLEHLGLVRNDADYRQLEFSSKGQGEAIVGFCNDRAIKGVGSNIYLNFRDWNIKAKICPMYLI